MKLKAAAAATGEATKMWIIVSVLLLGAIAAYQPVIGHQFVNFDDPVYVSLNSKVAKGLTFDGALWALTTGYGGNWHPVTWLSHMLDVQLFGLNPGALHAVNLLFHLANTLLLFWLLRRFTGSLWRSAFVASLFSWHPLHVESVAWISERKDVLSTFFGLLAMICYARYTRDQSRTQYRLALLLFALGLMSKPMLVTFPFVLLLLDYWPLQRNRYLPFTHKSALAGVPAIEPGAPTQMTWRALVIEKIPFFILTALSCVITLVVQRQAGAMMTTQDVSIVSRFMNALLACAGYLRKTFWPFDLAVFYPLPAGNRVLPVLMVAGLLFLISLCAFWFASRKRWLPVGWLWYLGTLVPVLGLVQVGAQSMADRYTYLPLVGIFIVIVWGTTDLAKIISPHATKVAIPAGGVILVILLALTRLQVSYWRNTEALFRHALAVTSGNPLAHVALGKALDESGKPEEARDQFIAALAILPDSPDALASLGTYDARHGNESNAVRYLEQSLRERQTPDAHFTLGTLFANQNKLDLASEHFAAALRLDPSRTDIRSSLASALEKQGRPKEAVEQLRAAIASDRNNATLHSQLGALYLRLGKLDAAETEYGKSAALNPNSAAAHFGLGAVRLQSQDYHGATVEFIRTTQLDSTNSHAFYNLGCAYALQGNFPLATENFTQALRLKPDDSDARSRLATVLGAQGKFEDAIHLYREAIQSKPDDMEVHYLLAQTLVSAGQVEGAVVEYRAVLKQTPNSTAALRDLAWLLSTSSKAEIRDGAEAVRLAERARQLTGDPPNPSILRALDAAYAEAGQFTNAIETAQLSQQVATLAGNEMLAKEAAQRIESYRAGKPWRQ